MVATVAGRSVRVDVRGAVRATRAEVARWPRPLRWWLVFLSVLIVIGAWGAVSSLLPGAEVFGTSPPVEWGLLIAAYVFFAVTTSGLCLSSSLGTVFQIERFLPLERRHAVLAVLSLVTAFGVIALDLHYPERLVFGVVLSPSPWSPMWWMGVLYGIYLCFLLAEVWSIFAGHDRIHRAACVLASIMAIIAPTTLGAVFGVLATRSFWYGPLTPPSLLVAALLSGVALLGVAFCLVYRFRWRGYGRGTDLAIPSIRLLLVIVLVIALFLTFVQTSVGLYGGVPGPAGATEALLTGPLAPLFWARLVLGLLLPLVLVLLPRTRTPAGLFAACCLALAGVLLDRTAFVLAGQIAPDTASSGIVSTPFAEYVPSPVEISIVVGAAAFMAFVYTLAERFLDLGSFGGHGGPGLEFVARAAPEAKPAPIEPGARTEILPAETGVDQATGEPPGEPCPDGARSEP